MDKKPLILSIIVPIYNVEQYLEECLDSLVLQDIPSSEYEIICVNDGSTDKSGEILDTYAQKYNNIVVVHKENGGVSSARNCGIDKAIGKYIWFIDSDDFIMPNSLTDIVSKLRNNNYDRVQIYPYAFSDKEADFELNKISVSMTQPQYKNFLWTQILRKNIITDNNVYFDVKISYAEDAIFMIQIKHLLKNSFRMDRVIYFYRLRENSLMGQNIGKKIESRINGIIVCDEISKGKRFGDSVSAEYFKYLSLSIALTNILELNKRERKKYIDILKNHKLFPLKYSATYSPKRKRNHKSINKRIKAFLSNRVYTRWGYLALLTYSSFIRWLRYIKNICK